MTHEEAKALIKAYMLQNSCSGNKDLWKKAEEYLDNLKEDADMWSVKYGEVQEEIGRLYDRLQQIARIAMRKPVADHIALNEIRELTKDISRE